MRWSICVLAVIAARPAEARDCVTPGAEVKTAEVDGDGVAACFDGGCWRFELASRTWKIDQLARADVLPVATPPTTKITTAIQVCGAPGACGMVEVPDLGLLGLDDVVESGDRSRVALHGPAKATERPIQLFDAASGKRVALIRPWRTPMGNPAFFRSVRFAGPALVVMIASSPVTATGRLYDARSGRRLHEIGRGRELDESGAALGAAHWVFAAFESGELFVHDVTSGQLVATIATRDPKTPPDGLALLATTATGAVVALPREPRAGLTVIEPSRKHARYPVPLCE
jgi:hypothetical protein